MMSVADFQNEQMWSREGRAVFNGAVRAIFAAEPSDLSMLHFLGYLQSGGGLMKLAQVKNGAQQDRFVGGAQQLSIRLAEIVQGHGQRLLLNALVHKICQESVGVRVESSAGSFRTHKLIVAIPPTLAKEIEFQPPLPEAHQKLLDGFVMGAVIKVIAIYPTPFWRQAGLSGEILSHSNALRLAFDASPSC